MPAIVTRRAFVSTLASAAGGAALYVNGGHILAAAAQGAAGLPPEFMSDLVAGNHILVRKGVMEINGHLSGRHPGNPNRFFLSRAIAPETVTAADIMEFDLDSKPIDARGRLPYTETWIHSEIYKARPDVMGVVHAHTASVLPFATSDIPLRPIYQLATYLPDPVPVFKNGDRGEVVSNAEQGRELARVLGSGAVALMHGHGAVIVSNSVRTVVSRTIQLDMNARVLQNILSMGGKPEYLHPAPQGGGRGGRGGGGGGGGFNRDWDAWLQEEKRIMEGRR
jgi:HCOMODA/2-hydroxy-3-carboxy-muconic semialdehyde decarboxylase